MNAATETARFADLLREAVEKPGTIHAAYAAFHAFSLGNQILALTQCEERGITPGPLATFPRWKDRGRFVRKGEKAITLCMPVTCKRRATDDNADAGEAEVFTRFVFKPRWFVLSQTDGTDYAPELPADWNLDRALAALDIQRITFESINGNSQGYARARQIAISPIAALPHKTTFHELAHVVLGHTAEADQNDGELTPRSLREAEAESVALLCCETLGLDGADYARGYIQNWLDGDEIPEGSARRIFKAADAILKAGRPAVDESEAE
jgi:antirestriction protein ArdC